jgi:hypothetical protein
VIKAGFRDRGVWPFDAQLILKRSQEEFGRKPSSSSVVTNEAQEALTTLLAEKYPAKVQPQRVSGIPTKNTLYTPDQLTKFEQEKKEKERKEAEEKEAKQKEKRGGEEEEKRVERSSETSNGGEERSEKERKAGIDGEEKEGAGGKEKRNLSQRTKETGLCS